jgi:hypothetical protein
MPDGALAALRTSDALALHPTKIKQEDERTAAVFVFLKKDLLVSYPLV